MISFEKLPNFLIIGAAKSGTTTLFDVIAQHPEVFASEKKEIRFFSNNDRFQNGVEWYQETHFGNAEKFPVRAEATPAYLTWSEKVAPRIKDVYKNRPIKFAVIFRDPVKRAYSHYWHRVRQGDENPNELNFTQAIRTETKRLSENWPKLEYEGNGLYGYFRAGCYASRLQPFLKLFPSESFFFMLQEDLYKNFNQNLKNLAQFLEIDPIFSFKPTISNESAVPRNKNLFNLFNYIKKTKIKDVIKPFLPPSMRKWVRTDGLMKHFDYPPMDDEIKEELYGLYADEIKQLEAIIKKDLSHWQLKK